MTINPSALGEKPYKPSVKSKIARESIRSSAVAVPDALPLNEGEGWDVSPWLSISVDIFPITPNLRTPSASWNIIIVPWWYKKGADLGTVNPQGQWFCGNQYPVSLDGDPRTAGPMILEFPTDASERFYVQIIEMHNAPVTWEIGMGVYGLLPRSDLNAIIPINPIPPVPLPIPITLTVDQFEPLAIEQGLYTNLRGDFTVTRTGANQLTITDIPPNLKIDIENIVAVGRKPTGTDEWEIQYRGKDLHYNYVPATGILTTLAPFNFGATDLVAIWVDNRPKARAQEQDSDRAIPVNLDCMRVTMDGGVMNYGATPGTGGAQALYFPMAEEGYRRMSLQLISATRASFYIYATDDVDRFDGDCNWVDVTLEALGAAGPISTPGMYESIVDLPYRRIQILILFLDGDQELTFRISRVS